jgi:type IV conjugative transfer system lipoprotein TraV
VKTSHALLLSIIFLTAYGCGASFTCPAPHGGLQCSSVSTVYQKALSGELESSYNRGATGKSKAAAPAGEPLPITARPDMATTSAKLETDKMVPLRVPPRIIRIWLSPWEDSDGDLNQGGYVFSEITDPKNRWVIGEGSLNEGGSNAVRFFSGRKPLKKNEGVVEKDRLTRGDAPAKNVKPREQVKPQPQQPKASTASNRPSPPAAPAQQATDKSCEGETCRIGEKVEK